MRLGGGCCHPPPPSEGPIQGGDGELDARSPLYSSDFCHDCLVIAILSSCLLLRLPATAWLMTAAGCGLAATQRIINPMTLTNTVPRPASCHPQAHRTGHQARGRPQMTLLIFLIILVIDSNSFTPFATNPPQCTSVKSKYST